MEFRVIHTEQEYEAYLAEAERLAGKDPVCGSTEADRLELLAVLLENYERTRFSFPAADPIEAIRFRMEEQQLQQKDLVPFIGSSSRVSEVLSGQRRLTIEMIRGLSAGLGIPADVLIGAPEKVSAVDASLDLEKFPHREMQRRGYFDGLRGNRPLSAREQVQAFLAQIGVAQPQTFLFKRTLRVGSKKIANKHALYAWLVRIVVKSRMERNKLQPFDRSKLTDSVLKEVARLSWSARGPVIAEEFLAHLGISLVIEPQLTGTRLDGAALLDEDGTPIVALTIRRDQADSFWFTLMHELVHIQRHLRDDREAFLDDTETADDEDPKEREANRVAGDVFIPRNVWRRSDAFLKRTDTDAIKNLAYDLRIHQAIVAGRIQRDVGNYRILNELVGRHEIRQLFPHVKW